VQVRGLVDGWRRGSRGAESNMTDRMNDGCDAALYSKRTTRTGCRRVCPPLGNGGDTLVGSQMTLLCFPTAPPAEAFFSLV
jgi:hypothetical protein